MKTVTEHIRDHLLGKTAGLVDRKKMPTLDQLRQSEWDEEFERLMRNRLLMGAFRYGLLEDPGKGAYDHLGSIRRRLEMYEADGNLEHLVDAANICLVEFHAGRRRGQSLSPQDDGEHCIKVN